MTSGVLGDLEGALGKEGEEAVRHLEVGAEELISCIQSNMSSSTRLRGKCQIFFMITEKYLFFLLVTKEAVAKEARKVVVVRGLRKGQCLKIWTIFGRKLTYTFIYLR